MCKHLGPVWVRHSKYPLLLLLILGCFTLSTSGLFWWIVHCFTLSTSVLFWWIVHCFTLSTSVLFWWTVPCFTLSTSVLFWWTVPCFSSSTPVLFWCTLCCCSSSPSVLFWWTLCCCSSSPLTALRASHPRGRWWWWWQGARTSLCTFTTACTMWTLSSSTVCTSGTSRSGHNNLVLCCWQRLLEGLPLRVWGGMLHLTLH